MKKIRIGSGAGYSGDRVEPAVELLEKGNLDYMILECLAERTIALAQRGMLTNPESGYNPMLEMRMRRLLPLCKEHNVKMITNMGAANPRAAAEKTAKIAGELGVTGIKIACVTGDNIFDRLDRYYESTILENGKKLGDIKDRLISANAYLGGEGIVEALRAGADVVITGRVADPALTVAPLMHEFGWNMEDTPEVMGQAVIAGHLLECAGQVTGGYYADPGYKDVPDLHRLGYPLIEIDGTGKFIITKVEGSGGMVTKGTCSEQLIYEIHDPEKYYTPDAVADFSKVTFTEAGKNRVLVENARASGRPETLKVSVGYRDSFIGEGEISYGGSNCIPKAELAADIIKKRLELIGVATEELRTDLIGVNSLFGNKISQMMRRPEPAEVRLRVSARTADEESAEAVANEIEALYTNGPAGGGGAVKRVEEVISACSIFVPREDVSANVEYMEV